MVEETRTRIDVGGGVSGSCGWHACTTRGTMWETTGPGVGRVAEQSYGDSLSNVVATAQQYNVFRWDIHCRLLRPHGLNMAASEHVVKQWNQIQKARNELSPIEFMVQCFRVGLTYDDCWSALQKVCLSEKGRQDYDQDVRKQLKKLSAIQHLLLLRQSSTRKQIK